MKTTQDVLFQKTSLENGITIVTGKMPHVRSICMGLWVPTGSRHESYKQNGISHFVEHMLFKGTEKRSVLDIATAVDSLGGEMNAFTSRENTAYYIKVLDEHFGTALDILSDIFLHSVFDKMELEKERQVIIEEIRLQEDQPEEHVHDLIQQVIWSGQPLGFPIAGRIESISSLNREGLVDFIQSVYRRTGIVISCAGNVDHQGLVRTITETFGDFSIRNKKNPSDAPRYHAETSVMTKDLEQVHLCLSFPGIPQKHPDRYAFYILNNILGGNMSSRLFQEVREKRGLAYSVYSYLSSYTDSGAVTIYAGAGRERIKEVNDVIRKELYTLAHEAVSDGELANAKKYVKGGLLLSLESSSSNMSRIAKQELNLEKHQSIDEIIEEIERVSSEKLLEIAAENFQPEQMSLAAIGPIDKEELIS